MKSTSSWPSRQTSRYSGFVVRTTVVVRTEQAFEIIAATMFVSSREVQAISRSASVIPAAASTRRLAPLPSTVCDVVALRDRGQPLLVEVEDRQLVLVVKRLHDRRADLAGADDEDLHVRRLLPPPVDPLAIVAADEVVARARLPRRARRRLCRRRGARGERQFKPRAVASGFSQPIYVTGAKGEPGRLYVVEQGGVDPRAPGRQAPRHASPRHPEPRQAGGEQGLLGLAFHPVVSEGAQALRPVHGPRRLDEGRRVPRRTGTRASRAAAALLEPRPVREPQRRHARVRPQRPAHFTMGDGGSGGDPENRAQNMRSLFGKLLSLNVATKGLKIEALGLRNAWRFSFDRANGDLYIGDVGQGSIEEIDWTPGGEPRPRELRLGRLRGPLEVRGQGARPRQARLPGRAVQPRRRLLGHRRLRLPRLERVAARALHLRRLLQRARLELQARRRQGDGPPARGVQDREPDLVRRGHRRRALRASRTAARSTA